VAGRISKARRGPILELVRAAPDERHVLVEGPPRPCGFGRDENACRGRPSAKVLRARETRKSRLIFAPPRVEADCSLSLPSMRPLREGRVHSGHSPVRARRRSSRPLVACKDVTEISPGCSGALSRPLSRITAPETWPPGRGPTSIHFTTLVGEIYSCQNRGCQGKTFRFFSKISYARVWPTDGWAWPTCGTAGW